jgi:hypothetical protein
MGSHSYGTKQIQNRMKCSNVSLLSALHANIDFPNLTAAHYLKYTFQQSKYSRCCTLFHSSLYTYSIGSVAIQGNPLCDVASMTILLFCDSKRNKR